MHARERSRWGTLAAPLSTLVFMEGPKSGFEVIGACFGTCIHRAENQIPVEFSNYFNRSGSKCFCTPPRQLSAHVFLLPFFWGFFTFSQAGFDALYFGRIDYQDAEKRIGESNMEMLWRSSRSSEEEAQIFTGTLILHLMAEKGVAYIVFQRTSSFTKIVFLRWQQNQQGVRNELCVSIGRNGHADHLICKDQFSARAILTRTPSPFVFTLP